MLKRNKAPGRDASSKSGEETGRLSLLQLIPESGRSNKAVSASNHRPNETGIVARSSGHDTVMDSIEFPSVQKTAAVSVDAVGPSESCAANDRTAPEAGEARTVDRKSLWDLAYDALKKKV